MEVKLQRRSIACAVFLGMFALLWFFFRAWAAGGLAHVQELGEAVIEFLEKCCCTDAAMCADHPESHIGSTAPSDGEDNVEALDSADGTAHWIASRMVLWVAERIVLCKEVALYPWGRKNRLDVSRYYAVAEGWHPGVYGSWRDCREAVMQYPTARFKSFCNREAAEQFVVGWGCQFVPSGGFKPIP